MSIGLRGNGVYVRPDTTNVSRSVPFLARASGEQTLYSSPDVQFNPSTQTLSATNITGSFIGDIAGTATKVTVSDSDHNGNLKLTFSDGANSLLDNVHLLYNPFFQTLRIEANNGQTKHLILQNSSNSTGIQLKGQKSGVAQYETNILNYQDNFQIQNTGGSIHIQQVGNGSLLLSNDSGSLTIDSSGNIQLTGSCTAQSFSGSGSGLTGLTVAASAISGLIQLNQLAESAITLGSTTLALGSTITTLTGLTSVTSNSFVGDLNGDANSAYKVSLSSITAFSYNVPDYIAFSDLSGQAAFSDKNLLKYYAGLYFNGYQGELTSPNLKLSGYATIGGALTCAGGGIFGNAASQHSIVRPDSIELGIGRVDSGVTYIDFHGSPVPDYSTRLIRSGGVDGSFYVTNSGQGVLALLQNNLGMFIDSAGNVGIGTSIPHRQLTIGGTSYARMDFNPSSHTHFTVGSDEKGFSVYDDAVGGLEGYRMVVNSSGNVGIGEPSPTFKLQLGKSNSNCLYTSILWPAGPTYGIRFGGWYTAAHATDHIIQGSMNLHIDSATAGHIYLNYYSATNVLVCASPSGGSLGIGTQSPNFKLHVAGDARITAKLNVGSGYDDASYGAVQVVEAAGTTMIGYVRAGNYAVASGFVPGTNDFAFAGWSLTGTGVKLVQGAFAWTSTSDERTKDITSEITGALGKLSEIRCVRFRYKTDCMKDKYGKCQYKRERIGFIAQDVQKVFPEAVHDSNGVLGLTYQDMIVVNTSAIKELSEENTRLKTRLDSLEQRLLRIENPPWFTGVSGV